MNVTITAVYIARSVDPSWCSQREENGFVIWRAYTLAKDEDGKKIWMDIGKESKERLEAIQESGDVITMQRIIDRLRSRLKEEFRKTRPSKSPS